MKTDYKITFCKSELSQYNYILKNEEIRSRIADFLLKYVSIEAFYKKLLIAKKEQTNNKKLTEKEKKSLKVYTQEVMLVLKYFGIECDVDLIERIFGSNDKNYMDCSIKKLRDRMVHRVNDKVLQVILERYETINHDLNEFLNLFNV